jgi:hypothetical protein
VDIDIDPDVLKEDLRMKVNELQGDTKHLGYDLSGVRYFLEERFGRRRAGVGPLPLNKYQNYESRSSAARN